MSLDTRIGWLLIGCLIGFLAGYIVRSLREIREKVEEVDQIIKSDHKETNHTEDGSVSNTFITRVALVIVVALTAWAAFSSQSSSNKVTDTQNQVKQTLNCDQTYLVTLISTLNARTTYSVRQASSNVMLQSAQAHFLGFLLTNPPPSKNTSKVALEKYFSALNTFLKLSFKTLRSTKDNPFPKADGLVDCIHRK